MNEEKKKSSEQLSEALAAIQSALVAVCGMFANLPEETNVNADYLMVLSDLVRKSGFSVAKAIHPMPVGSELPAQQVVFDLKLAEATRALVNRMKEIEGDPRYRAVWEHYSKSFGGYTGPQYSDQLEEVEKNLARIFH